VTMWFLRRRIRTGKSSWRFTSSSANRTIQALESVRTGCAWSSLPTRLSRTADMWFFGEWRDWRRRHDWSKKEQAQGWILPCLRKNKEPCGCGNPKNQVGECICNLPLWGLCKRDFWADDAVCGRMSRMSKNNGAIRNYSTQRPVRLGTYPSVHKVREIYNFDERLYVESINRKMEKSHIGKKAVLTIFIMNTTVFMTSWSRKQIPREQP